MSSRHTWETTILRAGSFRLDGGSMFGVIPKPVWSGWATPDENNRIRLDCNCVLLRDGERTVLVETGYGSKWSAKDRKIFAMEDRTVIDALNEISIDAGEITHVILSHLHFDHAGALTLWKDPDRGDAGGFVATFPNAKVITQARELKDALDNRSTMTRTYLRSHLDPISDDFVTVEGAAEPLPGITVRPVPGHTWGQQAIHWSDENRPYVFPGDLCPTLCHAHPSASMAYDMEPWTTMCEKVAFLEDCVDGDLTVILGHDPDNPIAKVIPPGEDRARHGLEPLGIG